jgi:saccharopine dehydrogenase (NAD+, L-lysine-forming)
MSGSSGTWLIYGANGYTGRLLVDEAVRRGEKPILAGRREDAIAPLAERFGLERRIFELDAEAARHLDGVAAVLVAAGPFSATSRPALDACMAAKAHYLDVAGEIDVFEACFARRDEAVRAGIAVLPGVGFDVVPSDCLAARLKEELPDAVELELAFAASGPPSAGTTKSMLETLPRGGMVRRHGKLERVPANHKQARIPFRDRERDAVSIPWGDVSTAWWSTRIPDITVYLAMAPALGTALRVAQPLFGLLESATVRRAVNKLVETFVAGPDDETRRTGKTQLWGRVRAADGRTRSATLETPEVYLLTARTAVEASVRTARGRLPAGAMTPSKAFGPGFITEFADCTFVLD